jgi:hypothetical protein
MNGSDHGHLHLLSPSQHVDCAASTESVDASGRGPMRHAKWCFRCLLTLLSPASCGDAAVACHLCVRVRRAGVYMACASSKQYWHHLLHNPCCVLPACCAGMRSTLRWCPRLSRRACCLLGAMRQGSAWRWWSCRTTRQDTPSMWLHRCAGGQHSGTQLHTDLLHVCHLVLAVLQFCQLVLAVTGCVVPHEQLP